jgi:hypothetical protein
MYAWLSVTMFVVGVEIAVAFLAPPAGGLLFFEHQFFRAQGLLQVFFRGKLLKNGKKFVYFFVIKIEQKFLFENVREIFCFIIW